MNQVRCVGLVPRLWEEDERRTAVKGRSTKKDVDSCNITGNSCCTVAKKWLRGSHDRTLLAGRSINVLSLPSYIYICIYIIYTLYIYNHNIKFPPVGKAH